jgi:hypothetical protein
MLAVFLYYYFGLVNAFLFPCLPDVHTYIEDLATPIRDFAERVAAKNFIEIKGSASYRGTDSRPVTGTVEENLGQTITIAIEGMHPFLFEIAVYVLGSGAIDKPQDERDSVSGGVYSIEKGSKKGSETPPTTALVSSKSSGSIPNLNPPVVSIQVQAPSKRDKEHDKAKAKEEGRKEKNRKSESPIDKKTKK